ncbi:MAG: DUF1460 domain-containing protein [bacterium]|nr:DUF1460 domain-containing protein [bacterium]
MFRNYPMYLSVFTFYFIFLGLSYSIAKTKITLTEQDKLIALELNIKPDKLAELKAKPMYKFSEKDLDIYLGYIQKAEPNLRNRVVHLGRKNIGQPYKIYLLGEFPFELYDADPMYCLKQSDCVVFSEHTYAMALAKNWREFFVLLQRIRYKNGEIGMLTRNHYTEADWDINNSWLVEDITEELVGNRAATFSADINRAAFFEKYHIGQDIPIQKFSTKYIPCELIPEVLDKLQNGDFVNVVRGYDAPSWVGHTGLIAIAPDGTVDFLHSTPPKVTEQPLLEYMNKAVSRWAEIDKHNAYVDEMKKKGITYERKGFFRKKVALKKQAKLYGFKFLRLRDNPLDELRKLDGADTPRVTAPLGLLKNHE